MNRYHRERGQFGVRLSFGFAIAIGLIVSPQPGHAGEVLSIADRTIVATIDGAPFAPVLTTLTVNPDNGVTILTSTNGDFDLATLFINTGILDACSA